MPSLKGGWIVQSQDTLNTGCPKLSAALHVLVKTPTPWSKWDYHQAHRTCGCCDFGPPYKHQWPTCNPLARHAPQRQGKTRQLNGKSAAWTQPRLSQLHESHIMPLNLVRLWQHGFNRKLLKSNMCKRHFRCQLQKQRLGKAINGAVILPKVHVA